MINFVKRSICIFLQISSIVALSSNLSLAQSPSNYSFSNPPQSNDLISSGGTKYHFAYMGPFNIPAYPGEPGVNPIAATGTITQNGIGGGTSTVIYNMNAWSPSNPQGTLGEYNLSNIMETWGYFNDIDDFDVNACTSITASSVIYCVWKVTCPYPVQNSSNWDIIVKVMYGSGFTDPGVIDSLCIAPGSGSLLATEGGTPSSLNASVPNGNKKYDASSYTMVQSQGIPAFEEVNMVNGVGYLYIEATPTIGGNFTITPEGNPPMFAIDNADATSDWETIMESISGP